MTLPGAYGTDGFGSDPYGYVAQPFSVLSATVINPKIVTLTFDSQIDFGNPATLVGSSYSVVDVATSLPLLVLSVTPGGASSVNLKVSPAIDFALYLATVTGDVRSLAGTPLNPLHKSAYFNGQAPGGVFDAAATSSTRIRLLFKVALLNNATLASAGSYTVTDLLGVPIPVLQAVVEPSLTAVTLLLGASMSTTEWYIATVGPDVRTAASLQVLPATSKFQYVQNAASISFDLSKFTGEVRGGLFGNPLGLVFFSPALSAPAANSVLQVDSVTVCTRAYDTYTIPIPIDPPPFYTWGQRMPVRTLNTTVLWAPFPRLVEARTVVSDRRDEAMPLAVDSRCIATLNEPWAHDQVALLNNTAWKLFDNTGLTVPPLFICANNLVPIPPGPPTTIVLEP
jgi:hypothetical protein